MIITHNMSAMNAANVLKSNTKKKTAAMEHLGSGYRIDRSADDPAGMSISEKMRGQIRGLQKDAENLQAGINYVQVADGALSEVHNMLIRMEQLCVQGANDTYTDEDREAIDGELQQLKKEMERIFEQTEYNTIKIWDPYMLTGTERVELDPVIRPALTMNSLTNYSTITNANKESIPKNEKYSISVKGSNAANPSTYGFTVKWDAINGNSYESRLISWDEVGVGRRTSFSFALHDYLDTAAHPELAGLDARCSFTMDSEATAAHLAQSLRNAYFNVTPITSESATCSTASSSVWVSSLFTNYSAELVSGRDFDHDDTAWIEPLGSPSNVIVAPTYTDVNEDTGWTVAFTMPGIGEVRAVAQSMSYSSSDRSEDKEDVWWYWSTFDGTTRKVGQSVSGTPTLKGITEAINNTSGHSLVNDTHGQGGSISVTFSITPYPSTPFGYKNNTQVGSMGVSISVSATDTAEAVMARIRDALNPASTIIDGRSQAGNTYGRFSVTGMSGVTAVSVTVPQYTNRSTYTERDDRLLHIQAGPNTIQTIDLEYESLRLSNLGLTDTNTLTRDDADASIMDVQYAQSVVSEQRSLFGAYQNRMEHALDLTRNYEENLQASESRIRDADMADEAVELAKNSVLEQTAEAMLAGAKENSRGILKLLE